MGSVVTLVLVFGKTVLGVVWTENGRKEHKIIQVRNRNAAVQEHLHQKSVRVKVDSEAQIERKRRSQIAVQFKRSSNLNDLKNKRVKTCDLIEIGSVITIDNQSMTVLGFDKQHEYVIPDYYIREYDEENVLIDTSFQYLYHYEIKEKPHLGI